MTATRANATGDGTYFAGQEPGRLGFTRVQNRMWVAKFRTEAASYHGRISAYGDAHAGVAWISDDPCDAAFGAANELVVWSQGGGGMLTFVVVRDEDEAKLDSDPALAAWAKNARLRADHCYYVAFENTTTVPPTAYDESYVESVGDDCGATGDGTCYYLAMDFNHLLHSVTSGQLVAGNVIPGLTMP